MAEGKKSFVLYADLIHTVRKMPKAKQGDLLMTILSYVNDENPVVDDLIVSLVWEPIKQQLKRDLKDWDEERRKRSEAGRLGGIKSGESRRHEAKRSNASSNEANEADNVNVTVNVNDNVSVIKRDGFAPPTKEDVYQILSERLDDFTAMAEADKFVNFYESKNWMVGKNKMKNWKAAAAGWITRMNDFKTQNNVKPGTSATRLEAAKNF